MYIYIACGRRFLHALGSFCRFCISVFRAANIFPYIPANAHDFVVLLFDEEYYEEFQHPPETPTHSPCTCIYILYISISF